MSELGARIISGNASADEVAAVMAVLTAISAVTETKTSKPELRWGNPAAQHRRPLPTSWATSFLNR